MSANRIRVMHACRRLSLFADAHDDLLAMVSETSFVQLVPTGTEVLGQDMPVEYLFGVVSGAVEAVASHDGLQTLMYVVPHGRCFVHSGVILGTPSFASFCTTMRSDLLMIPAATIRDILRVDNGLAVAFATELARTTDMAAREVLNQKLRSAPQRLAALILREHARSPETNIIDFNLPKRKVAQRLGATPETLSRILAQLRTVGVETDGNRYIINDVDALRAFAKPSRTLDPSPW